MPKLSKHPAHLGLGAAVRVLPEFTGEMSWYATYGQSTAADGKEGRLVTQHTFTEPWSSWEMHPVGDELVLVTQGALVLIQELPDGSRTRIPLQAGEYAINPAGVWHTADADAPVTAVFITAGMGTEHRGRTD